MSTDVGPKQTKHPSLPAWQKLFVILRLLLVAGQSCMDKLQQAARD